jgi:hypothetical protein
MSKLQSPVFNRRGAARSNRALIYAPADSKVGDTAGSKTTATE